jgi:hypothetical protein
MRTIQTHFRILLAASLLTPAAGACTAYYDEYYVPLLDGATGGSGGTGGTTTTIDPGCIPSQATSPVRDDCGVFVSASKGTAGTGDGSKDKPYATIAEALASPAGGPIYLCAETFAESVQIKSGTTIYGALDCTTDWKYTAANKSEISPDAGMVPLVVDPQVALVMQDVRLRAKDAAVAGGSSIAMIASTDAEVELTRCDVEAGNGRDGAPGEAFAGSAPAGAMGNSGTEACMAAIVVGGGSVTNACDAADPDDNSISGAGGIGQDSSGGAGSPGLPLGTMNAGTGQFDDAGMCTNGAAGDPGMGGTSGTGAQGMGTISAQGYLGASGTSGTSGKAGQGGGGGGGAKGGNGAGKCSDPMKAGGASGGSGGSGGCAGLGGKGGQAGGASIGIVSIGATLMLADVTITAKNAGKGGNGGDGQLGGMGGSGGSGGSKGAASSLKDGCAGGPGGAGGAGGKGGGGLGGYSIGIAHTGEAPAVTGATITMGTAGNGGVGDGDMGTGAPGMAAQVQSF